ncbi:hypothetical protein EYF80_043080 [Liparis tanakae]|uniref:Uncharacterized protein n=1 Tax=Liparis tanakae TaxID=230148 RepID=A0A4Z2G0D6_9TELE|nr:hypothetical protein EYF80_043080 [Liparis tanakae]
MVSLQHTREVSGPRLNWRLPEPAAFSSPTPPPHSDPSSPLRPLPLLRQQLQQQPSLYHAPLAFAPMFRSLSSRTLYFFVRCVFRVPVSLRWSYGLPDKDDAALYLAAPAAADADLSFWQRTQKHRDKPTLMESCSFSSGEGTWRSFFLPPCIEGRGILMSSRTMDDLGDFLCASVM